ncbi:MAG: tripartite tricarboxylate transporter substrate binding protein, partial [Betaproteobacteria bacterium]|nr:tripartite tricarboxylate transporter substrate binding protein [Betaproteobacteria bacterium]
ITNTQVVQPALFAKLPYDIMADFEPVSWVASLGTVLVVHPSVPANSVKEYIALARSKPNYVTFGSSGFGSPFQLGGELLKTMTGVDMLHVPYKGSGQVTAALLAGEVMSAFAPLHSAFLPHIQSGKLRALGMASPKRSPLLPEVPTIAEAGPLPGYAVDSWFGVVMPAGTPKPITERLSSAIAAIVRDPALAKERLLPQGWDPVGSTPAELVAFMKAGIAKYAKLVKDAKIRVE